ncbi:MAG: hypothetical protein ACRCX2_24140 [Paraclostridium sp.]
MRIANCDLSLNVYKESKKFFQLLLITKYDKYPFFTNLLINMTDIEDVHEEQKESSLAYTYFDHTSERLKIRLNYNWLENGMKVSKPGTNVIKVKPYEEPKEDWEGDNIIESGTEMSLEDISNGVYDEKININFDNDNILFLIYHELLHNYFHHFTRHEKYREKYSTIANIVEDFYINEFLYRLFKQEKNFTNMPKELGIIDFISLNDLAIKNCKEPLPFGQYEDKPLESTLIDWFIEREDKWTNELKDETKPNSQGGFNNKDGKKGTGDHKTSNEYYERSLEELNEKRSSEGRSKVSPTEAGSLASKKIDDQANNALDMAGKNISHGENDCIRHKSKILKKDPFLNYVKITNTLKKMLIKGCVKNYSKPNRRRQSGSIVYKQKSKQDGLHIVVGIDVSGSVSDAELVKIYDMLGTFLEKNAKESSIDIFYWSSCRLVNGVHFHKDIKNSKELLSLKIKSSGGTVLKTAHDLLKREYDGRKIQFLNITDGYFEFDEIPSCVIDYYICLTEDKTFEPIKRMFPKAIVRVCRARG